MVLLIGLSTQKVHKLSLYVLCQPEHSGLVNIKQLAQ